MIDRIDISVQPQRKKEKKGKLVSRILRIDDSIERDSIYSLIANQIFRSNKKKRPFFLFSIGILERKRSTLIDVRQCGNERFFSVRQ